MKELKLLKGIWRWSGAYTKKRGEKWCMENKNSV